MKLLTLVSLSLGFLPGRLRGEEQEQKGKPASCGVLKSTTGKHSVSLNDDCKTLVKILTANNSQEHQCPERKNCRGRAQLGFLTR